MGFPMPGEVLSWEDTKKYAEHVRQHGIIQLINWYKRVKDRKGDDHKWGDEIEYLIVKFLEEKGEAKCSIRSAEILDSLDSKKNSDPATNKAIWLPECGAYMIEATPLEPYNSELSELNRVEKHLIERRKELSDILNHDELPVTVTIFPRLGAKNFTFPPAEPTPDKGAAQSLFFPDDAIYQVHGRYLAATQNIRGRRGENPPANVPIYMDKNTKIPVDDSYLRRKNASPDHVYLDTLCFGMGFCCLQITFQTFDLTEARVLYDQLGPITPIMLALTAASPMIRGFLTDVDCRWGILAAGGDCRTEEERGLKPLAEGKVVIPKPRCCSIRSYLTPEGDKYNDLPLVYFEENYRKLVDNGIDHLLAAHFAFLFIRDTISLTSGTINQNDEEDTGHFEIHQTMNWPSLRFKLPLPKANCGWRVELRPCESQLTDFENAAVTCFAVLLTRVIFAKKTNFLIPISKIDENMDNAQKRNAAREQKFWFRRDITTPVNETTNDVYVQLTLNEVINGKEGEFIGLIPVIENHLSNEEIDKETRATIQKYLKFVSRRASGEILTTASWLRKFVTEHPDYRSDSIVSEQINYDLMKTITDIQSGKKYCPLLLGPRSEN